MPTSSPPHLSPSCAHPSLTLLCPPCQHNRAAALHNAYTSATTTIELMISRIGREKQTASENLTQMVRFLTNAAERAKVNGSPERSTYLRERVRVEMRIYEKRKRERNSDLEELEERLGRVERGLEGKLRNLRRGQGGEVGGMGYFVG